MAGKVFAEEKCAANNDNGGFAGFSRRGPPPSSLLPLPTTLFPMSRTFTIAIGSDHAGFAYKEAIKAMLLEAGHTVRDLGTYSDAPCDYPDFIRPVAEAVARGEFERGIV